MQCLWIGAAFRAKTNHNNFILPVFRSNTFYPAETNILGQFYIVLLKMIKVVIWAAWCFSLRLRHGIWKTLDTVCILMAAWGWMCLVFVTRLGNSAIHTTSQITSLKRSSSCITNETCVRWRHIVQAKWGGGGGWGRLGPEVCQKGV